MKGMFRIVGGKCTRYSNKLCRLTFSRMGCSHNSSTFCIPMIDACSLASSSSSALMSEASPRRFIPRRDNLVNQEISCCHSLAASYSSFTRIITHANSPLSTLGHGSLSFKETNTDQGTRESSYPFSPISSDTSSD